MGRLVDEDAALNIVAYECGEFAGLAGRIEKRIRDLPSVQPEQRWIPCSERLPELNSRCVLLYGNDNISGGYYRGNRTFDVDYGDKDVKTMVIAWMDAIARTV